MTRYDRTDQEKIQWLLVILSIVAIVALVLLYAAWRDPSNTGVFRQLVTNAIPSALVVLIAVPIGYYLFSRKGTNPGGVRDQELASFLAEALGERDLGRSASLLVYPGSFQRWRCQWTVEGPTTILTP